MVWGSVGGATDTSSSGVLLKRRKPSCVDIIGRTDHGLRRGERRPTLRPEAFLWKYCMFNKSRYGEPCQWCINFSTVIRTLVAEKVATRTRHGAARYAFAKRNDIRPSQIAKLAVSLRPQCISCRSAIFVVKVVCATLFPIPSSVYCFPIWSYQHSFICITSSNSLGNLKEPTGSTIMHNREFIGSHCYITVHSTVRVSTVQGLHLCICTYNTLAQYNTVSPHV